MSPGSSVSARSASSRLRALVIGGLAAANLFVLALAGHGLLQSRQQHEARAQAFTQNLAAALDQSLSNSVDKIDFALRAVVDELEHQLAGPGSALDPARTGDVLARYQQRLPEVEAIRIADADGRVILGKGVKPAERASWADREYFRFLRDHAEGGLQVSPPRVGRVAKQTIVGFARRYNHPDGRFAGVVSAPMAVARIDELLARFDAGAHGSVAVRYVDLGLIVRRPPIPGPDGTVGSTAVSAELRALEDRGVTNGTFHTTQAADGVERIVSFRRLENAPLLVVTTVAREGYLAGWSDALWRTAAGAAGFALLSLFSGMALLRLAHRLRESEQRYRLLLQNSPVGILHYDTDLVVTYANGRFEQILQVPPGALAGLDCKGLKDQALVPVLREALRGRPSHYQGPCQATASDRSLCISMDCAPVADAQGRILGGIAIVEDITERSGIEARERRQRASLAHLNEIAASAHLPLAERMHQALAIGAAHLGLEYGIVAQVSGAEYRIVAQVSPPDTLRDGQVFPFGLTYCQITLDQERVVAIAEMGRSPYLGHPCYETFRLESYIGSPVHAGGTLFGTVNFGSPRPYGRSFDDGDEEFMRLLAQWVGAAIDSDRAQAQLALAASVFGHAHEGIVICDADQVILDVNPTFTEITGYGRDEILGRTPRVLASGRQDAAFYRAMWADIGRRGHWDGEIWNRRQDGTEYAERLSIAAVRDDQGRVSHYIGTFSDISPLKQHEERLEFLAHYDPLTHLPNRALLADRMAVTLAQARRAAEQVAVCYLDLDGFKAINDELGHGAGDKLLVEVAQRLKDCVRAGDTVARLGGDEFVLLLAGLERPEDCDRTATRMLQAIAMPIRLGDAERCISGSLGIALFPPDDSDADTLLRHADQAMYRAKQAGKNRYQIYDPGEDQRAHGRGQAREALAAALARGEFRLYYQPIIDMRQGRVVAFEGLLRWAHPERGLLPAAAFLAAAEGSELDLAIGRWVLGEGLRQLAAWREVGLMQKLSLNVSAHHLLAPAFAEELRALLAAHPGVEAGALGLETPEAAAVQDVEAAIAVFRQCRAAGIEVALDDFGTGYSSLSHFRRLPVDTLKIDQSFVQSVLGSEEDLAIVESVIALTRAFSRKLVAEGVEALEVAVLLLNLGCDVAQGNGIARPMPGDAVPGWLARFHPDPAWAPSMMAFSRQDMPLYAAAYDHRTWVSRLGAWLDGDPQVPTPPALDARACRFGHWYDGAGRAHYGRFATYAAIGSLHDEVHRLGQELVALQRAGRGHEARRRFPELAALRDRLIEQISALQTEALIDGM